MDVEDEEDEVEEADDDENVVDNELALLAAPPLFALPLAAVVVVVGVGAVAGLSSRCPIIDLFWISKSVCTVSFLFFVSTQNKLWIFHFFFLIFIS